DVVTFPFTVYKNIRQLKPGTTYHWQAGKQNPTESIYWQPLEEFNFSSIDQAATELRSGIQRYVNTVSENMPKLAQFISAGEIHVLYQACCHKKSHAMLISFLTI